MLDANLTPMRYVYCKCFAQRHRSFTLKAHEARSKEERRRIATPFTDDELYRIDDWGFSRRIRDRSQMVRELVFAGLAATENEKGEATA